MSTIDEIMAAIEVYSYAAFEAGDYQSEANAEKCRAAGLPIRDLIAAALADARREGAEQIKRQAAEIERLRDALIPFANAVMPIEREYLSESDIMRAQAALLHEEMK